MNPLIAFLGVRGTVVAAFALAFAAAAGIQTVRLWKLQAETAQAAGQLQACRDANAGHAAALKALENARKAAEAERQRQAEQAAKALDEAKKVKADAERELADFRARWGRRPASCAIALTQMEDACASSLSDY